MILFKSVSKIHKINTWIDKSLLFGGGFDLKIAITDIEENLFFFQINLRNLNDYRLFNSLFFD
jgi:hypothetical protein